MSHVCEAAEDLPVHFSPAEHERMKAQADSFLRKMPANLQSVQRLAIEQAIEGHSAGLENVRQARNGEIPLPEQVEAFDPTPGLRLYRPKKRTGQGPLPLLVYFHGGGWTIGSINSCARFCGALAATGQVAVLAVDYPLAPEHPFPAALNACVEAVRYALRKAGAWDCSPHLISVGGDSSGGNLALAVSLMLQENTTPEQSGKETLPPLKSLLLFYPVTKAYNDGSPSWQQYGTGYGLDAELMEAFNEAYLTRSPYIPKGAPEQEPLERNYLVSPAHAAEQGRLQNLPPVLLIAAGRDILRDQGESFINKLQHAGMDAQRIEFPEATHLFITVPGQPEAFQQAVELSRNFLRRD